MRNRAKCKLCQSTLESFHRYDYVTCKCGEIAISGGLDKLEVYYKNIDNFMRVDDEDNLVVVQENLVLSNQDEHEIQDKKTKINREDKIEMLNAMVKSFENLPEKAMSLPVSHYDLYSFMLLVSSILRDD